MTVQITIIGMGQVGTSIGLALAGQKNIKRVGHDKNHGFANRAKQVGAVDDVKINLPASVSQADVVILSLPLSEIRDTLEYIAQDLKEGCVIFDTAPAKATVAAWALELIPQGRYYVGLAPAAGAEHLYLLEKGVDSARADFFNNGLFLINTPPGSPGEVLDLAISLVGLLGAYPLLTDSTEADGLLAATHLLPQLAGAALVSATMNQPGWMEGKKIAARPYAAAASALMYHDEAQSLADAALANRENVTRLLDAYIESLANLRHRVEKGDEKSVAEFIENGVKDHERWLAERTTADWRGEPQNASGSESFSDRLNRLFVGNLFKREKKK